MPINFKKVMEGFETYILCLGNLYFCISKMVGVSDSEKKSSNILYELGYNCEFENTDITIFFTGY